MVYLLSIFFDCFDFSVESPQAAAMAAGESENLSGTGKCAWFHGNSSISLTNMQVSEQNMDVFVRWYSPDCRDFEFF
jgi:hypothetical protein